jgi:hypothetical protein
MELGLERIHPVRSASDLIWRVVAVLTGALIPVLALLAFISYACRGGGCFS